ncbi:hypothetical protein RUND412_007500 [Rhizina undulata]
MPIQALPESSVRALGSGQVLTDPPALLKELLENSLDAGATAVSLEVSQNLLDVLQVKDNGYGIPPEDREFVALRYCTSKIRSYDDIGSCTSLGFRGEALASAAELANNMIITTRVDSEKVAQACEIDRGGRIVGRKSVSAQRGTVVKVTGFFGRLPVRRENALKSTAKFMANIKTMLQTYYLSHPSCRLSLRILASAQKSGVKGRDENIIYAPSKSIPEAVRKAIGKDVPAACEWIDTAEDQTGEGETEARLKIEAFLPKSQVDPAVICKKLQYTHFVFVNGRPVSCSRGPLKQILQLYKAYLRSTLPENTAGSLTDPFIYLNICPPRGTYDPNVEPAKDDILFDDAEGVVRAVEAVFKRVYGELKPDERARGKNEKVKQKEKVNGFELLLARKKAEVHTPVAKAKGKAQANTINKQVIDEEEEELAAIEMDAAMDEVENDGITPYRVASKSSDISDALRKEDMMDVDKNSAAPLIGEGEMDKREGDRDVLLRNSAAQDVIDNPAPLPQEVQGTRETEEIYKTPRLKKTNWGFNMHDGGDESGLQQENSLRSRHRKQDIDDSGFIESMDDETLEQELLQVSKDPTLSNPWITAKMNAPISPSTSRNTASPAASKRGKTPLRPFQNILQDGSSPHSQPNPGASSPAVTSLGKGRPRKERIIEEADLSSKKRKEEFSTGNINSWLTRTPKSAISPSSPQGPRDQEALDHFEESEPRPKRLRERLATVQRKGFITAAEALKDGLNIDGPEESSHSPSRRPAARPRTERVKRRRVEQDGDEPSHQIPEATLSPHENRFRSAAAALSSNEERQPRFIPPLLPRQKKQTLDYSPVAENDVPAVRVKSRRIMSLLPLDVVPPEEDQTFKIRRNLLIPGYSLRRREAALGRWDEYIYSAARVVRGFELKGRGFWSEMGDEARAEDMVRVLREWVQREEGTMGEVRFEVAEEGWERVVEVAGE